MRGLDDKNMKGCAEEMKAKYINPFTDFGFKKLFGEEGNKDLLIDFLNSLLPIEHKISDITFANRERLGEINIDRKAIYDIFCVDEAGKHFIVEMQNAKQLYFKDRAVFYSTFPIREQAEKGEWNFELQPVYCVGLLGFEFALEKEPGFLHEVQLKDQNNEVFFEKLTYIFVELPKFNKTEDKLENKFEKWLYFLKNLEDFESIPDILNEEVFKKAFLTAEIANFNEKQLALYEESVKVYRDNINIVKTAIKEGEEKGLEKGLEEGRKEGRKEGQIEGQIEELKKTVNILLCKKFNINTLPDDLGLSIKNSSQENLKQIRENIFDITSLKEVRNHLNNNSLS